MALISFEAEIIASSLMEDTVKVKKGNYIMYENNVLIYIENDTIILRKKQEPFTILTAKQYEQSMMFYGKMKNRVSDKKWIRKLYGLLFDDNVFVNSIDTSDVSENTYEFSLYKGKKIKSITYDKEKLFEDNRADKTANIWDRDWYKELNALFHVTTKDYVLDKNLLFELGDTLSPIVLADNERILRELPYIKDASIEVSIDSIETDKVNVKIAIQDIWPVGFNLRFLNSKKSKTTIYDRNVFGFGQEISSALIVAYDKLPDTGFEIGLSSKNFMGSFINYDLDYYNAYGEEKKNLGLNRPFVLSSTNIAGGLNLSHRSVRSGFEKPDTMISSQHLTYKRVDLWGGYSFPLKEETSLLSYNTRLVLSSRLIRRRYQRRPSPSFSANYKFHNKTFCMLALSLSKQNFYKTRLLYGFGVTEDIPHGILVQVLSGYEWGEFSNRLYLGANISAADMYKKIGYLYFKSSIGSFLRDKSFEQGAFVSQLTHGSALYNWGNYRLRSFFNLDYTLGLNRFEDEALYFGSSTDIRGLSSLSLYGNQKLSFGYEPVVFSPIYFYGFRFVFYGFADFGIIGPANQFIFDNDMYSGFGVGVRARNDNLAFNTFSFRFSFYPRLPFGASPSKITVYGTKLLRPERFDDLKPYLMEY